MFDARKKWIMNVAFFLLFIIAMIVALGMLKNDLHDINLPSKLHYNWILPLLIFQVIFWFFSILAWRTCIVIFTQRKIPFVSSFIHCNTVAIGKYLPGKIWGMIGRGIGLKERGLNAKEIVTVSYFEQITLLHSGFIIGSITYSFFKASDYFIISIPLILLSIPVAPIVYNKIIKIKFAPFLTNRILLKHIDIPSYLYLLILYLSLWCFAGFVFSSLYYFLYGFDFNILFLLVGACTVGILVGFLAFFSPGGIGVREATSVVFLSMSIPLEKALLLVIVYRVWTTLTDLMGGLISMYLVNIDSTEAFSLVGGERNVGVNSTD